MGARERSLKSITLKIGRTRKNIDAQLHPNDGLTDLGRKVIGDPDKPKREAKHEKLNQELEELELQKEGLELKLKMKQLLYSGEVWIKE